MILQLRTEELTWRQVDDEVVALDARQAEYLAVNGSGALLWTSLASGATRAQLVQTLVQAYRLDEEQASADADAFIASLAGRGLLAP